MHSMQLELKLSIYHKNRNLPENLKWQQSKSISPLDCDFILTNNAPFSIVKIYHIMFRQLYTCWHTNLSL